MVNNWDLFHCAHFIMVPTSCVSIGHCDLLSEIEYKDTTNPHSTVGLCGIACLFLSINVIAWDYYTKKWNLYTY